MRAVLFAFTVFCVSLALPALAISDEDLRSSTFDFGSGSPFLGQATLGDIRVRLVTTNTEPFGRTAFRDQLTGIPAQVVLCFSRPIGEFRISFSRVLAGEVLRDFGAGPPSHIEGDLYDQGGSSFSVPKAVGDNGKGTLIWRDLNSRWFTFVIDNPKGWATAVDGFALSGSSRNENSVLNVPQGDAPESDPCEASRL